MANSATYAQTTASTWSSTTRSSLFRVARSACATSAAHGEAEAPGPVPDQQWRLGDGQALEQPHQDEQLAAQLVHGATRLVLVLQRPPRPNSATVAGCR